MWEWVYRTDWQAWATFGAGALNAFAIFLAARFASSKFDDWRKQRRSEKAELILEAFYEAEEALSQVRSPMSTAGEADRAREGIEEENPTRKQIIAQVGWNRMLDRSEKWQAIIDLLASARVVFGTEIYTALRNFLGARKRVEVALQMYTDIQNPIEFDRTMEADFWYIGAQNQNPPDRVSEDIESAKKQLEEALKPFID